MDKAAPTVVTNTVMVPLNVNPVPVATIVCKVYPSHVQIGVKALLVHYVLQQGVLLKGVQQGTLKEESAKLVLMVTIV